MTAQVAPRGHPLHIVGNQVNDPSDDYAKNRLPKFRPKPQNFWFYHTKSGFWGHQNTIFARSKWLDVNFLLSALPGWFRWIVGMHRGRLDPTGGPWATCGGGYGVWKWWSTWTGGADLVNWAHSAPWPTKLSHDVLTSCRMDLGRCPTVSTAERLDRTLESGAGWADVGRSGNLF